MDGNRAQPSSDISYCLMESQMDDRRLYVDEIAAYHGIKGDTNYKWIAQKGMPAHRVGRLWKFSTKDMDEWVPKGKAAS